MFQLELRKIKDVNVFLFKFTDKPHTRVLRQAELARWGAWPGQRAMIF